MSETGSTTGWGVGSSVPSSPTIQSYQTADFLAEPKQAVSAEIFAGIVLLFQSPVTLAVSQADFSLQSPHPKIPFPAVGFAAAKAVRELGNLGIFLGPQRTFAGISAIGSGPFWSLRASLVFGGDLGGPVSASKNPVPRGPDSAADMRLLPHGNQTTTAWQPRYFRGFALLLWVQPKRFELPAPFRGGIAQPLDIDASRQTALHGSADQLGSQEGERDRHVYMPDAALFT